MERLSRRTLFYSYMNAISSARNAAQHGAGSWENKHGQRKAEKNRPKISEG